MNNNLRPFFAFIAVVVLLGAAFGGVLTFAARYNNRVDTPEPIAQVEEGNQEGESQNNPAPQTPAPEQKPAEQPKQEETSTPTPQPEPKKEEQPAPKPEPAPVQSSPAPSSDKPAPAPIVTTGAVPATGPGANLLLTSIFIAIATFLALIWRSQTIHIRTNR